MEDKKEFLSIDTTAGIAPKKYELLPIYNDKNPNLRIKSVPFNFEKPQLDAQELAIRLDMTMRAYGGVGLAAIQCNIPLRVFALACDIVAFNPTILGLTEETKREKEGCLSFPGIFLPITRPIGVQLEWYDEKGVKHTQEFTGLTARTILHEYDHLEGILFTGYVGNLTIQMARKKRDKMIKRHERAKKQGLLLSDPKRIIHPVGHQSE